MKHFLDLGTHLFEGLGQFTKRYSINSDWKVYCYEPNPYTYEKAKVKVSDIETKYAYFEFNNAAVMDTEGEIKFHCRVKKWVDGVLNESNCGSMGSTAIDNPETSKIEPGNKKVTFELEEVTAKAVSIVEVLGSICEEDPDAEIYVKCDIEGSEYVVLPAILESPYCEHIENIHIEWHDRFWLGLPEYLQKVSQKSTIKTKFINRGVKVFDHE